MSLQILIHKPDIWFTSDYHAYHQGKSKPCQSCMIQGYTAIQPNPQCSGCKGTGYRVGSILTLGRGRPFKTIEEHNAAIADRHNEVVRPGDLVYYLGDFALKCGWTDAQRFRRRLAGNFYFLIGNHDGVAKELFRHDPSAFVWMKDLETIKPKIDGVPPITLCHYAMKVWPGSHRGTYHLYGHSHGKLPEDHSLSFDVGVDTHDFRPYSLDEVREKMLRKMPVWLEYKESLKSTDRAE